MTKNEQIEEMVSIMAASNNPFVDVPIEIMPKVAEALYNAGYRKINDDCAVITKDELKKYKAQAVKEFSERLKTEPRITDLGLEFVALVDIDAELEELLKEYHKWTEVEDVYLTGQLNESKKV